MHLLITFSEITLKSNRIRSWLSKELADDIKKRLGITEIENMGAMFHIKGDKKTVEGLCKIPGVSTIFIAEMVGGEDLLEKVIKKSLETAKNFKGTFAVRCKNLAGPSTEINEIVGEKIVNQLHLKVNLSAPDNTLHIRMEKSRAFLGSEVIEGMGGLPIGTQGKVVVLFSGGIDSPVASLLVVRKGCRPYFVYFDLSPFSTKEVYKRATDSLSKLKPYFYEADLILVPFGSVIKEIKDKCALALTCVICKRSMYKIANIVAKKIGAKAIVTGESLGEVASQTLQNLSVLDEASEMMVLRPLVGLTKQEIVDLSKKYGLFDVYKNLGDCLALPERVETAANLQRVIAEENKSNLEKIIAEAAENAKIVKI